MDLATYWLTALILGLLEGATEFLPVSSTGHLIIAADFLNFEGESAKVFEIFIQLGAILAVMWNYQEKLLGTVKNFHRPGPERQFLLNLFIAFLPAAIFGLMFHKYIKEYLFSPVTVAIALIVGGIAILLIEAYKPEPHLTNTDQMTWKDALKIGLAQSLALFPGVSRAGATIMGGLVNGLSRPAATEFSFFLAIPTMIAATVYDLYKNWGLLSMDDLQLIGIGFAAAFVSGFIAVRTFIRFVSAHSFRPFAYYRIVFGVIVLLYFWL